MYFDDAGLPEWFARAACLGDVSDEHDPWFASGDYSDALATCEQCPVREPCGAYAQAEGFTDGVFGGLTPKEREHAHRDDRAA